MNKVPRPHWQACQVLAWLLVLFSQLLPAALCRLELTPRSTKGAGAEGVWLGESSSRSARLDGKKDYSAPPFTRLPYTDPYVIERGGGDGGIRLKFAGGRPVKEFVIPRREIEGIVRLRYDMDVVDWTDVVVGKI